MSRRKSLISESSTTDCFHRLPIKIPQGGRRSSGGGGSASKASKSQHAGAIAGAVVGVLLGAGIFAVIALFFIRRRRQRESAQLEKLAPASYSYPSTPAFESLATASPVSAATDGEGSWTSEGSRAPLRPSPEVQVREKGRPMAGRVVPRKQVPRMPAPISSTPSAESSHLRSDSRRSHSGSNYELRAEMAVLRAELERIRDGTRSVVLEAPPSYYGDLDDL